MAPLPSKDQRHTWLRMSDTEMGLDVVDTLCFQFGGVRRRMTWRQFILALGLHTKEEMAEDGFRAYWLGSERTPKKVTCVNLFYLRSIDQGTANVMDLLAQYLFRHDEGRKSGARLSRVVTCGLPLIDLHKLGRLNIYVRVSDTSSWVAPGLERQPDVAVGAPGAIEDALAVDEGVRLIQHLWRHLSHRHLPPGLCSRGFTSSRMRMQYGVSLGLGYGVLTTCIDLAVKKSTIWLGLWGYCYDGILSYENEVLQSLFMNKESELEKQPLYDRFVIARGMHVSQPSKSETQTSDFDTCESDSSEPTVNEPKVVSQPMVWSDAPIIEEYASDSEDEHVSLPTEEQETPSFANQQVKTPRETIKNQFTNSKNTKVDKKGDCDFHEKRMAKQAELNNKLRKKSSQRELRPIWNNVQRVNHQNQFVPAAVLTRTGKIPVSTARASGTNNVSTARHNFNRQAVPTNAAMKVNIVKPIMNRVKLKTIFYKTHSPFSRPFNNTTTLKTKFSYQKVDTAEENAVSAIGGKRETAVKPSAGCNWRRNRHYWQNISKYNSGSSLRNCFTFKDPLGRLKPKQAWVLKRINSLFFDVA
ncbi:hypothetical protein Tco_0816464, partial [Tanacetum coccineum]